MRSTLALLALAAMPLFAQESQPNPQTQPPVEAPAPPAATPSVEGPAKAPSENKPLFNNVAAIALQETSTDTNSSKFREYRDIPEGFAGPQLRIFDDKGAAAFLVTGENLMEHDRRVYAWVDSKLLRVDALYDQIPHRLGNDAKTPEVRVRNDAWGINDFAQASTQAALERQFAANRNAINFNFLRALVEPYVAAPTVFDLGYERRRASLSLQLFPDAAVDSRVTFFQENRTGVRAAGTSFGFGNVVETGEPIDYKTRDVGVRLEAPFTNGLVRGSVSLNQFFNALGSYTFDNPFRVTDATDPSAYTAPASGSIGGAAFGRLSLPPDNNQLQASIGGMIKLPLNSRLTADVVYGRLRQNDALIPYTTNTAITFVENGQTLNASDPALVPSFDGKINTLSGTLNYTIRPIANVNVTARYRYYDMSNQSPRVELPGYVRFDAVWEDIPRITVPYSWRNNRAEVLASYDLGIASVEGGYRIDKMHRTFRETEDTTENIFHIATDLRAVSWAVLRASYEFGSRDFNGTYDLERSEGASFVEPEPTVNLPELRRFDQAKRDTQRIVTMVEVSPFDGNLTVGLNYVHYFDDYTKASTHGLLKWRTSSLSAEADYTPSERWNVFAFGSIENWGGFQRGRQSGATPSTSPLDDWTADNTDKAKTWGAGANFGIVPNKVDLRLSSRLQIVNGRAQLESPPGGTPDLAFDIPRLDDTKFLTTSAEVTWRLTGAWDLGFGAWIEHYKIRDDPSIGLQMYMPGGFFLAPNDSDYQGNVAYVRTSYHW